MRGGRGRRGKRKRQESELEDDSVLGESVEDGSVLEKGVQGGGEEEVKRLLKNLIKVSLCQSLHDV